MKMREIMETASGGASAGATSASSMAPSIGSLGTLSRSGSGLLSGKYTSEPTPNTPAKYKRKNRASR
jgi:hypothetical protein